MKNLSADKRFAILRANDGKRVWRSPDDQRVCTLCHRLFTGHEVRMVEISDGHHEVHCPTLNCASRPIDWFSYGSAQNPTDSPAGGPPQRVEIDLNFSA